jgi:hypothetical protein
MATPSIEARRSLAVRDRLAKSKAIKAKATWSTDDHRRMMAAVLVGELNLVGLESKIFAILEQIDNASAFQAQLETRYLGTGHFQRKASTARPLEELEAELDAVIAAGLPAKPADKPAA